jgi:hypothetical protein
MANLVSARARRSACAAVTAWAAILLPGVAARAQDPMVTNAQTLPSIQTVRPEAQAVSAPARAPDTQAPPQETPQEPAPTSVLSNMRIRGYADVGFGKPPQEKLPDGGLQNATSSFQIADFHLFVTAKLSDDWSFLSETLITSDFTNETSAEMDRMLFQYGPSKHLRVGFGKFNTSIGYYSNQFHRAKFYQTATGRPLMFSDEDNGGILPVHQIGITVQGEIPSGALGLHYIGEVTNGRSFNSNSAEVQNFTDGNNGKAVNAGLFVRPDAAPGLDAGFTVYRDTLDPDALGSVRETITAVHAAYLTPNFEFLNEVAILAHHFDEGGVTATSKSFYTQVSNRFGITRPYVRYEYQDVPATDLVFRAGHEDVAIPFGLRKVVSGGVRVDLRQFAAIKVQVDHALQNGVWASGAHAQLAFAF